MVERLLSLLDNEHFLHLFERVVRERKTAIWPEPEDEEQRKTELKELHAKLLQMGFDRGLAMALTERDQQVRADLERLRKRTGGIVRAGE